MRSSAMDKGIRTGVIFGVIIVTMFLIGFTMAGAGLVGKLFGVFIFLQHTHHWCSFPSS